MVSAASVNVPKVYHSEGLDKIKNRISTFRSFAEEAMFAGDTLKENHWAFGIRVLEQALRDL